MLDFKPVNHEVKKMLPAVEDHVASQGPEIMKESAADGKGFSQQAVVIIGDVQSSVNEKGEQIQGEQGVGEMLITVAKVMFQMVALIFEYIDIFILDLPAGTPYSAEFGDIVERNRMIGGPSIVIDGLAGLGMGNT